MTAIPKLTALLLTAVTLPTQSPQQIEVAAELGRGVDGTYSVAGTVRTPELTPDPADATTFTGSLGESGSVLVLYEGSEAQAALNADPDGDGEMDYVATAEPQTQRSRRGSTTEWSFEPLLEVGVTGLQPVLTLAANAEQPTLQLRPTRTGYAHGRTTLGDQELVVLVADLGADGRLGNAGDGWIVHTAADMEQLTDRERPRVFRQYSMIEVDEPCFAAGRELRLVGADGASIELTATTGGDDDLQSYLHRRNERVATEWRQRFEGRLAPLIAQRREEGRERAEEPIEWLHTLRLEAALERAKAEGKPILADFETDWCIWCKVLDHLTYPDSEVAAYVRENFVPVKFNAELLVEPLTKRYEVRGYPTILVIAPDGSKVVWTDSDDSEVDAIVGFQPPSEFLDSLRSAREAFDAAEGDGGD